MNERKFYQFLDRFQKDIPIKDREILENNIVFLNVMYEKIQTEGGYIRAFSNEESDSYFFYEKILVDVFKKYFLTFEYWLQHPSVVDQILDHGLLHKVNRLDYEEMCLSENYKWNSHQISLMPLPQEILQALNDNKFTLDAIKAKHGNQHVDIRVQRSKTDSFRMRKQGHAALQLTINQYIEYQQNQRVFMEKLVEQEMDLNVENILFAVNIDTDTWNEEFQALNYLFPHASFLTKQDGLSSMRTYVQGVNLPQIYLKVADVFTGGHQESLNVNSVNINHGPAESIWITIDFQYVDDLRRIVKEELDVDILFDEGLWFKSPEYFIMRGIPIKYTRQKPGDVIFLGPGCLHQVKSEGITVQSAWNFMTKDIQMVQAMIHRYEINRITKYKTIIPIKHLFMDIYHHERNSLPQEMKELMQEQLICFWKEERQELMRLSQKYRQIGMIEHYSKLEIVTCYMCQHEIFNYFIIIDTEKLTYPLCMTCIDDHLSQNNEDTEPIRIQQKYKDCHLMKLLEQQRQTHIDEICPKFFVGQVNCPLQKLYIVNTKYFEIKSESEILNSEKDEQSIKKSSESLIFESVNNKSKKIKKNQKQRKKQLKNVREIVNQNLQENQPALEISRSKENEELPQIDTNNPEPNCQVQVETKQKVEEVTDTRGQPIRTGPRTRSGRLLQKRAIEDSEEEQRVNAIQNKNSKKVKKEAKQ